MSGSASLSSPPARGARLDWNAIPHDLLEDVESRFGEGVVDAQTQLGGFSPGVAARIRLKDGRRAFVKAVHPSANPEAPNLHRREAVIAAALPAEAPVSRFLWSLDQGPEGWVVLAFEDIDGRHPREPWASDQLGRVTAAMVDLTEQLTPSPVDAQSTSAFYADEICSWQRLLESPPMALDQWSRRNLGRLAELDEQAPAALAGDTLLHLDLRADNILLAGDRVYFVDWPHARTGAAWADMVLMAPSVAMQGGPACEEFVALHPAVQEAHPDLVTAVVAADAGFFTHRALQPPPPGLPTLRSFQAAQGRIAREWLARRTGWD